MTTTRQQILPADDTFDTGPGASSYGANVLLYLGCTVTTLGSPFSFDTGNMHGGYQDTDGSGVLSGGAAITQGGEPTGNNVRPRGFMFRQPHNADVTVEATFRLHSEDGQPTHTEYAHVGVMARIDIGNIQSDGATGIRYQNVSCYLASLFLDGSSNLVVRIDRVNSGTVTNLAITTISSATAANFDVTLPMLVTLDIVTNGAQEDLIATFFGFGTSFNETLTISDTSGSRLTNSGRSGFCMARDRNYSSSTIKVVDLCDSFSVQDTGSGNLVLLDKFERYQLNGAVTITGDQHGKNGPALQMAYYWDQFTKNGTARFARDTVGAESKWVGVGGDTDTGRAFISTRHATNDRSQHRQLSITIDAIPTAGELWTGVALRASQPDPKDDSLDPETPSFPAFTGYFAVLETSNPSGSPKWLVGRYNNGVPTFLGEFDDTVPTHFPGFTTQFVLDFEVYPRLGSTLNEPAILILKVDGVQVPLVVHTDAPSGVLVDANGTITDGLIDVIYSGVGEAVVTYSSAGATNTVLFDAWTESTLTNEELPDRDQLSVSIQGEGTPSGNLNTVFSEPDHVVPITREHYRIRHPMESGHRSLIPRYINSSGAAIGRDIWRFTKSAATQAELDALRTFFAARDGIEEPFTWTDPEAGAASGSFSFVSGSLRYERRAPGSYMLEFDLQEIK